MAGDSIAKAWPERPYQATTLCSDNIVCLDATGAGHVTQLL